MWNLYLLPVTVYPCASLIYCNIYFTLHWWWLQYIVFHIVNYLAWVKSCVRYRLYCILLWIISYIVFVNAEIVELLCRACADEVGSVEFCRQAKHSLWAYFWASHTGHAKCVCWSPTVILCMTIYFCMIIFFTLIIVTTYVYESWTPKKKTFKALGNMVLQKDLNFFFFLDSQNK